MEEERLLVSSVFVVDSASPFACCAHPSSARSACVYVLLRRVEELVAEGDESPTLIGENARALCSGCELLLRSGLRWGDFIYYPMDDGLEFEMHGYLDMAQGMLNDPPQPAVWIEDECDCEVSLWSY